MTMRSSGNGTDPERLHSVRRALAVLEALAVRPSGATPKELSRALGLHLSTCYRLLKTLVSAGYVTRDPGGLFRLGSRVAYLNYGYLMALRPPPQAVPFLHALQLSTGESVMLCQLEGDLVVNSAMVAGTRPGAIPQGYAGLAAPAHAFASGRVLLAGLSPPRIDAYLARASEPSDAPFPLTHPDAFRAELEQIRRTGYALDRGRGGHNVCCIAAPVVDSPGTVEASLAIVAPCGRFTQEEQALKATLLAVCRAIGALRDGSPDGLPAVPVNQPTTGDIDANAVEAAMARVSEAMSRLD